MAHFDVFLILQGEAPSEGLHPQQQTRIAPLITNATKRFQLGSRSLVPAPWLPLPGSRSLAPALWLPLPGSRSLAPALWLPLPGSRIWLPLPGSRVLAPASSLPLPGSRSLALAPWLLLPSPLSLSLWLSLFLFVSLFSLPVCLCVKPKIGNQTGINFSYFLVTEMAHFDVFLIL
jgi:hypothetical protein